MVRWFTRRARVAQTNSPRRQYRPRLLLQNLEQRLAPAVYTVLNNLDSGPGSLRDAVAQSNASVGVTDSIVFDAGITSATPIGLTTGELILTDSVSITGTSAANIIIDGSGNSRIFKVDNGATSQITVTFQNLTMQFGNATTALTAGSNDGGAIGITDEIVTVNNCILKNNQAWEGGAISVNSAGGKLTVVSSTIENNSAIGGTTPTQGGDGGGINIEANNFTLSVSTTTIRNNNAIDDGAGVYLVGKGDLTIDQSTISGNASTAAYTADGNPNGGGAIYWYGTVNTTAIIRNSTIANNTTQDDGGGIGLRLVGGLTVQNSTITGNAAGGSSTSSGGGFYIYGGRAPLTLSSTIVSGNSDGEVPDIWSNGTVTANNSAIGDPIGFRLTDAGGNLAFRTALGLGLLANNGGPTETIVPDPGSPLYNRGVTNGLTVDQRGVARSIGGAADIGATEGSTTVPVGVINYPAPTLGATTWVVTVTYTDDVSIDSNTIGIDDLLLTGPGVTFGSPLFVSAGVSAATVTAFYTFAAPDSGTAGVWDLADAGAYTITLATGQVTDTSANPVPGGNLGEGRVGFARTFTVTNNAASGPGSLDAAIIAANSAVNSTNTITFDNTVFAGPQTITLSAPLNVTNPLVVQGTGSSKLTIIGAGRIFVVDNYGPVDFTLSNVTLTGASTTGRGGAVYAFDDPLTLTNCVITGNTADNDGAGAAQAVGNIFNVTNCVITNNKSLGSGGDAGGLFTRFGATLTVTGSNISGNSSFFSGAGIYSRNDKVTIIDTTISGNVNVGTSNANAGGGGLYINAVLGASDVLIRNSTISDNVSNRNGGGILFRNGTNYSKFTIQNTTIAGNRSLNSSTTPGNSAGGLSITGGGTLVASIESSILSNNIAASFADISFSATNSLAAKNTAVGSSVGGSITNNGGNLFGATLNLGALGLNGGNTPTRLPAAGSPLINAGTNPGAVTTDQRGAGFPRTVGGVADIGAVESGTAPVAVTGPYADILLPGGTSYDFSVTYIDDVAIKTSTIDGADVTVTGPGGFSTVATVKTSPLPGDGTPRSVTYSFVPPGGSWDSSDSGYYQVLMNSGQVTDTSSNAVGAGLLGLLRVAIPAPLIVTTTTDAIVTKAGDAPGTLRQAIFDANANPGTDTISFDPAVFVTNLGLPTVINLTQGRLAVVDNLVINGLGTDRVAIDGAGNAGRRAMTISDSIVGRHLVVDVSKIGFQNFNSFDATAVNDGVTNGGAILIADEFVTFTDCSFTSNASAATGGAIHVLRSGANLGLTRTVFTGNSAGSSSTLDGGGAVRLANASNATITDCTFEGNTASASVGGAIVAQGGGLLVTGSSFIGNTNNTGNGNAFGGAVFLAGAAPAFGWTIRNSTFFGNKSGGRGGAIGVNNFGSLTLGGAVNMGTTLTIQNATITGNTSGMANSGASPGGGIGSQYLGMNYSIESSIISGNFRTNGVSTPVAADIGTSGALGSRVFLKNSAVGTLANIASSASPGFDYVDLGNNLIGAALNLDTAPAFNGGITKTVKFLGASPAIDAGSNPAGLTTDQTGVARVFGVRPDIGAYESTTVQDLPRAVVTLPSDVTVNNNGTFNIVVDYYDQTGISAGTIDVNDIVYYKFAAVPAPIAPTGVAVTGSGSKLTATYTFPVPVGGFNNAANGQYVVSLKANQVSDGTNFVTTTDTTTGVFRSVIGKVFTVTTNTDATVTKAGDAPGSLRQAIFDANASLGVDTVQFSFGGATTIGLTAGELVVNDGVVIQGQSAVNSVVSQAAASGRVFRVAGPGVFTVTFDSLTIAGGKITSGGSAQGAGIVALDENIVISNSVVRDNSTLSSGGGIEIHEGGTLTVINSTISNNTATGINGGGIFINRNAGSATITNSSITGNTATVGSGGGVYSAVGGNIQIIASTLSANSAAINGGGVGITNRGNLTVRNSTVSGNVAATGAGISMTAYFQGQALVQNSTVTGNTATSASAIVGYGGAIAWNTGSGSTTSNYASLQVSSTIVASNTSANFPDVSSNSPTSMIQNLIGVADAGFVLSGTGNVTGTKASPLDPMLSPLANNGGPTLTHALKAGSPALNVGFNPAGLSFDQRGTGFARLSDTGVDIGAFETQVAAPPSKFTNLVINNGDAQRSRVKIVRVNFDSPVSFVGSPAAAFDLKRNSDSASVTLSAAFNPGDSFVTLTFTGGAVDGKAGNFSLADGRYTLTLLANQFSGGGFDGNNNGVADGSPADNLAISSAAAPSLPTNIWRLAGDYDASGQVTSTDFLQFRLAFLSTLDAFDFDGSGTVDSADFLRFRLNFLATLP
ncbi:MAG: right-handed parallel beta-helix repeat-containing protein [Gemmataceae bacterium]|nr:right-handed parallel beta-helix repeat-containing protein [Gemmataceae bacterium]